MNRVGAVYPPDLIELMKNVLDDAAALLPEAKRTSAAKAEIAARILACAAEGERDEKALREAAQTAVVESPQYSHDVWREKGPARSVGIMGFNNQTRTGSPGGPKPRHSEK